MSSNAADALGQATLDDVMVAAHVYNENFVGDPVHEPFVAGSGYALPTNYESVLDRLHLCDDGGYVLKIVKIGETKALKSPNLAKIRTWRIA